MNKRMKGLDHLVLAVHNLDETVEQYKQLGFTITPRAKHPFGTHNCLIQLDGFFLEILTIGEPEKIPKPDKTTFSFPNFNQSFLKHRQGPSMLVLDTDDFHRDKIQAEKDGLTSWPVFEFSRQTTLPSGESTIVSFGLNFITNPKIPDAAFFSCQQFAPQHFWKPEYQTHGNTAEQIHEITLVADNPLEHFKFLSKFAQTDVCTIEDEAITIQTARGNLACRTPDNFQFVYGQKAPTRTNGPLICGFIIELKDITKVPNSSINIAGAIMKFIQKDT